MDLMFDIDQVQINNVQAVSATFLFEFSSVCTKIVLLYFFFVSPAYGNVSLALVKYSNEGGPGPRYNMKEVPGSILIMLAVHAYPMPLFSEAGDQDTSSVAFPPPPPPPSDQPGQGPLPPPSSTYSTACNDADRDQARWKSHFSL